MVKKYRNPDFLGYSNDRFDIFTKLKVSNIYRNSNKKSSQEDVNTSHGSLNKFICEDSTMAAMENLHHDSVSKLGELDESSKLFFRFFREGYKLKGPFF